MSDVTLTIGGRAYAVACAPGEEAHIADLGRIINDKLGTLSGAGGRNDSRSLLFAALLLADELHEWRHPKRHEPTAPGSPSTDTMVPQHLLDALAERLEALAAAMEAQA